VHASRLEPRNHERCTGFTAIELALVLAATSILIALGVSALHTYAVRAQVATSIEDTVAVQRLVLAAFEANDQPPPNAAAAGIDATAHGFLAGAYVDSLAVTNGRIDLRFGRSAYGAIAGKTLSLTPFQTADQKVVWICGNRAPGPGLEPLGFIGGAPRTALAATPIEVRYLPTSCR
jgi:type IV pilus assembly protein PilA